MMRKIIVKAEIFRRKIKVNEKIEKDIKAEKKDRLV